MLNRILLAISILLVLLVFPYSASAQPLMSGFQGTVTAGGDSLPDGTAVTAWIDGVKVAETETTNSMYSMFVYGDYTGKTVIFKVGKYQAEETASWTQGETLTVDLSIKSWPYQCDFFGEVTVNGQHVPDGTEVSAWIDSAKVQVTTTTDSMYSLVVPGNYTGKPVAFKVGDYYAAQIVEWKRGESIETNLVVSLGPLVCGFWGAVTLDGETPEDGVRVSAWIDSEKMAETTISDGIYGLNIPGDYTGKIVTFKVNGQPAKESVIWVRGSNIQTPLTAVTTGPISVSIEVSPEQVKPGEEFTLSVKVDPYGHGISGGEVDLLGIDTEIMEIIPDQVKAGPLLGSEPVEGVNEITESTLGQNLRYAIARKGETPIPTSPGALATIGFRVKGGVAPGKYAIPNAIVLTDEEFYGLDFDPPIVSIEVQGKVIGDLNGDDKVGLEDLAILASVYGSSQGQASFRADADLNSNDEIDIGDLAILGGNWAKQGA